jgi:hypothetical protein
MDIRLILVITINFLITLIGTLAYSVRIVGIRTGKIAVSSALFNAISLFSRAAGVFQLPLLTKYVAENKSQQNLAFIFYILILDVVIASIAGAALLPTFQKIFTKGVEAFSVDKSIFKLMLHSFSKSGVAYIKNSVAIPTVSNIKGINLRKLPFNILLLNILTVALLTAGIFSPVYAAILEPELSTTCMTLVSVLTGLASILSALFIDPYLSVLTDEVIDGKYGVVEYRSCVIGMVGSKVLGSALTFLLFMPAAYLIVFIAKIL